MKIIKIFFFSLLTSFSIIFLPHQVKAEELIISNSEYVLTSYDINIVVNENNSLDITERIGAYFNVEKHGIFRKIPLRNNIVRLDGTTAKNRSKISNIRVSDSYSLQTKDGYKIIKIGNTNRTLTGQKNYEISYSYNLGKDLGKDYDEFYFNLIGDGWDTTISNVTFTIIMPKEFDGTKLGFSSGTFGSTDSSKVDYTVVNNIIEGSYSGVLNPDEALTIRLELPEGYFINTSSGLDYFVILAILLPILFVVIAFILWRKYGRDDRVVETVEFYPPEGLNSAEVGFFYRGRAGKQDVISLLVYLANKGYIKIIESDKKHLFPKTKDFKIIKLKEYDGDKVSERLFLRGLFKKRTPGISLFTSMKEKFTTIKNSEDTVNLSVTEEVTATDLKNNFYITLNKIISNLNQKKNKIFDQKSLKKRSIIIFMIIITFMLITIKPMFDSGAEDLIIFALLFPGAGFTVMFLSIFDTTIPVYINGKINNSSLIRIITGVLFGGIFAGMPWTFMVLPALLINPIYLMIYISGLVCVLLMIIIGKHMPKRTVYGNEILGKIRGFKNFLEIAEKPKLEKLVVQNPSYFYDILPFAYVLGVSSKWMKKFETIALQPPNWYGGPDAFDVLAFNNFINNTMSSASHAMASSPSGDGFGDSGGGSSGGGSGGGGGGSW